MDGIRLFCSRTAISAALLGLAISSGASAGPPTGLSSSSRMTHDASGDDSWTYAQPAERFLKYRAVIVEPTVVYNGQDAEFGDIDQADRAKFAEIITNELRQELAKKFAPRGNSRANTLRLRVTLLGVRKTVGGVATATRVTPMGFASSALKSALGKGGTLTGSVLYAIELFDAQSGELLLAAVRRRGPDPLDVPATLSTTKTVEAAARDLADKAGKRLETLTGTGSN